METERKIDLEHLYPEPFQVIDYCLYKKVYVKNKQEPELRLLCNFCPYVVSEIICDDGEKTGTKLTVAGISGKEYYGYNVSVIDLRNPTRSDGNNLLHLVNKYMDLWKANPDSLAYKAKSEKYAKIIAKTIILSGMDGASFGQNAFFYDAAEGLLCASRVFAKSHIFQNASFAVQ